MNRARNFPPSAAFIEMADTLAMQIADLECSGGGDEVDDPLTAAFSATEKALTRRPVSNVGDLLLKAELLARIGEDTVIDPEEWQAFARDVRSLNGPGMTFHPEAWLRRWTHKGGGYVRTEKGLSFVAPQPPTLQQRLLLDELQRAEGQQAVAAVIDRATDARPTIRETWDRLRGDYRTAQAALDEAAGDKSDAACEAEIAAWDAMMHAPAPDLEAVQQKFAEMFWILYRDHYEPSEEWTEKFVSGVIDDVARITRQGGVS